jgi:hypothetical protein
MQIKKLEKAEETEKKRKRNTLILSIVMIGILVFSTAGYFSLSDNSDTSASEKVQNIGDAWIVSYGDQSFRLSNAPESGENVSILMFGNMGSYYGKAVYVASDSDSAFYEVASTLGRYTERMQQACYGKCNKDLPEKNCNETMIVITASNETELGRGRIYEDNNCLYIEGGLVEVDAFLYRIFEIN